MRSLARVTDTCTGICRGHSIPIPMIGQIVLGATSVQAEGLGNARTGDLVRGNCGHVGTIVSGSSGVSIEGLPAARTGDRFVGTFTGVIVGGASGVKTGS